MNTANILSSDYLDILYDGRNKSYGGYDLRKNYSKRMAYSMGLLVFLSLSFSLVSFLHKAEVLPVFKPNEVETKLTEIILPAIVQPPLPPRATPPASTNASTFKATPLIIAPDNTVKDIDKPDLLRPANAIPGTSNHIGDPTATTATITETPGNGTLEPVIDKPAIYVEQMPEPSVNLNQFLSSNLRYPELAKENNIEGRVTVRFVVNEEGKISDAMVIKGIGGGCDEEALRVVRKMPPWKPGKQNGRAVKVYYTLPITFTLE
jgi:periplasmic protein TonB